MTLHHLARTSMQVAGAGVIAEPGPGGKNLVEPAQRQVLRRRASAAGTVKARHHRLDRGLLEHHLAQPDAVRLGPRRVSAPGRWRRSRSYQASIVPAIDTGRLLCPPVARLCIKSTPQSQLRPAWCKLGLRDARGRREPSTGKHMDDKERRALAKAAGARGPWAPMSPACSILWRERGASPPRRCSASGKLSSAPSLPRSRSPTDWSGRGANKRARSPGPPRVGARKARSSCFAGWTPRHRGPAPLGQDPRAGEHLFRLPGHHGDAHPASPRRPNQAALADGDRTLT